MNSLVLQMNCGQEKSANIAQAQSLIDRYSTDNVQLIALPENWTCLGASRSVKLENAEVFPDPADAGAPVGPAYQWLRDIARRHGAYVHGGSMAERVGDRLYNSTIMFNPAGEEIARYRKIHLFDVVTPDGIVYGESEVVDSGNEIVTFKMGDITAGCAICYDVRFPELFRALRDRGAELIFLPAAFTLQTGKDHWETLLRARAIETQCWFIASATWGPHRDASGGTRHTYGNSLVCDPWGQVVARASDGIGAIGARIDTALATRVREQIPVATSRRLPFAQLQG